MRDVTTEYVGEPTETDKPKFEKCKVEKERTTLVSSTDELLPIGDSIKLCSTMLDGRGLNVDDVKLISEKDWGKRSPWHIGKRDLIILLANIYKVDSKSVIIPVNGVVE